MTELDKLTGFFTQKHFLERLDEEVLRVKRYKLKLSLLLVEVNYNQFSQDTDIKANFSYKVLKQLSLILRGVLRIVDLIGRYDGDILAVMMPETDESNAKLAAERLRHAVETYEFKGEDNQPPFKIAITVGVSTFLKHAKTSKELIMAAQKGLEVAKAKGNNHVETCPVVLEGNP